MAASAANPSGVSEGSSLYAHAIEPLHLLAALTSSALLIILSRGPIRDIDAWWHRAIGEEIWQRRTVVGLGNAWAPFGDQNWFTTQWLSEVGFYWSVALGGWEALPVIRVLASALMMGALAAAILPHRPARAAVPVYVLAVLGLMPALTQDRVQTVALLLAIPVGVWLQRGLAGRLPAWWQVALLAALWANVHGSWVLLPAVLGLLTLASLMEPELRVNVRRELVLTAAAVLGGLLNPTTWQSLAAVWRFADRTGHITEWDRTVPSEITVLPFVLLLVLLVAAWARSHPVPWAEVVVGGGLVAFSMLAFRNVLFAIVLLAPLVASRLSAFTRPRPAVGAEARALVIVTALSVGAALATAVALAARTDSLAEAKPLTIARYLASIEGPKRILNDYNTAGVLLEFGGAGIELGIDGRADRYPADYTEHYLGAQAQLIQWEDVVTEVDPDYAVLRTDNALPTLLSQLGWRTLVQDGDYVLMRPNE